MLLPRKNLLDFPFFVPKRRSNLTSFRERRIRPAYKGHFLEPCPFPHPPYRPGPVSESGTQGRHASSTLQYCSSTQEPLLYTGGSQSGNLLSSPNFLNLPSYASSPKNFSFLCFFPRKNSSRFPFLCPQATQQPNQFQGAAQLADI